MNPQARYGLLPALLFSAAAGCGQGAATAAVPDGSRGVVAPAAAAATLVDALPLRRGFYVASDTACSEASHATTLLLGREGLSGSHDHCRFERIEQTGPQTYRVIHACADMQGGMPPETSVVSWTIPEPTRFEMRSEEGWERSARHCEQAQMPPDWQDNDISGVTG